MAQDNVDISLVATEAGQTKKALDDVLKKLEKINKLSSFEIGKGDAEIQKLKKTLESLTDEKEKQNQKDENSLRLQTKLANAQKNGYVEAEKNIQDLIELNEKKGKITKKEWLTLQKITAEDSKHNKIITDKVSLNKQLISEVDKGNKKTLSNQKMLEAQIISNAKLEYNRLEEISRLRRQVYGADLSDKTKSKIGLEIYKLERNLMDENYSHRKTKINDLLTFEKSEMTKFRALEKKEIAENASLEKTKAKEISELKREQSIVADKASYAKSPEMQAMKDYYKEEDRAASKRVARDKQHSDMLEKIKEQQHMLSKMSINRSGEGYEKLNKTMATYNSQLRKGTVLNKQQIRDLELMRITADKNAKSMNSVSDSFTEFYNMLRLINMSVRSFSKLLSNLSDIDNSVYSLGVVSGKTGVEIEGLRKQLLEYAIDLPISASKVADSLDIVVRTGRNLAEAQELGASAVKLAVASNEDLDFIVSSLAKTLVSFKLSTDVAADSVDNFYSAVLKTPLSIKGLSDSMKNSSASFSTLINFTSQSGVELDRYKKNLLSLSISATAKFAEMGKMNAHLKSRELLGTVVRQANYNVTGNSERECLKIAC